MECLAGYPPRCHNHGISGELYTLLQTMHHCNLRTWVLVFRQLSTEIPKLPTSLNESPPDEYVARQSRVSSTRQRIVSNLCMNPPEVKAAGTLNNSISQWVILRCQHELAENREPQRNTRVSLIAQSSTTWQLSGSSSTGYHP